MTSLSLKTVVVGSGAVGSFFGAMLARAGHSVTLIARPAHVQAIQEKGLQLHMAGRVERVELAASASLEAVRGADLVLFCVKSTDTASVAQQIAPWLESHALVLSLQNGVENAAEISRQISQSVIPAVVYVATAMSAPGQVEHLGRGELVIGALDASCAPTLQPQLQRIVALFASAQIPVQISPDVMGELWRKLLLNCTFNAISAITQLPYGKISQLASTHDLQLALVHEVLAVAKADGQHLNLAESLLGVEKIFQTMPVQFSSTAQDLARGKRTEIDHLNGFIARRGAALGIATPANQALYALVKLLESGLK